MAEKSYYIHFEGMDLAGKSSASKLFAARRTEPWTIQQNSLVAANPARDLADQMLDSGEYGSETVGTVYAAALMADFDRFRRPEQPTIQESTILLRSIAYQAIKGSPRMTELFKDLLLRHPQFDASFMLTASHGERLRRLEAKDRAFSNHDLLIVRNPEQFYAMEAVVQELAVEHFQAEVIDTSHQTTEQVVTSMELTLQARGLALSSVAMTERLAK